MFDPRFSVFNHILHIEQGNTRSLPWVMDRIRRGASRGLIEQIRAEPDAEARNLLKRNLTSICFSGTFYKRFDHLIKVHSGLMVCDFDHVPDLKGMRETLQADKYVHMCFLSPSGDGLKAVVRVPPSAKEHRGRFEALMAYFNVDTFDKKNRNVSRVCYESWDPDLYYNPDSDVFTNMVEHTMYDLSEQQPLVRLRSEDKIIERLLKWHDAKYPVVQGQRNQNVFILASAFNRCAVSQVTAEEFLAQYAQEGFPRTEILAAVRSAYSKKELHGTGGFNDDAIVDRIRERNQEGFSPGDISKELEAVIPDKEEREASIDRVLDSVDGNVFWKKNKNGAVFIDRLKFKRFLMDYGFHKLYPEGGLNYVFVRVSDNLVSNTSEGHIKDFVLEHLERLGERVVYNVMASKTSLFSDKHLNLIDAVPINFVSDSKTYGTLFYQNCAVRVHNDNRVEMIDYADLGGFVWEDQIIGREFIRQDQEDGEFNRFVDLIMKEDMERVRAMRSVIGYLLHGYKDLSNNRAIILNDGVINDSPNGGSGKGIVCQSIGHLRKVNILDGKSFSFDKGFPYQTVAADCQVMCMDDVPKRFPFERLFSVITEGITLEKKNKDAVKIPVQRSPKIVITTNYAIEGKGGSHDRRKYDVELSGYFNANHTPLMEFGHQLFDGWEPGGIQWRAFDNYAVNCLALYLVTGLIPYEWENLGVKRFISETSYEFREWTDDGHLPIDTPLYRTEKLEEFTKEYPDYAVRGKYQLSGKRWAHWLDAYGRYKGYTVLNEKNQTGHYTRYVLTTNGHAVAEPVADLNDPDVAFKVRPDAN